MPYMPDVVSPKQGRKSGIVDSYRIDLRDTPTEDLSPVLDDTVRWISERLKSGGNVLVHCGQVQTQLSLIIALANDVQQGVSRSASIVIAYLMRCEHMSYKDAHALVLRQRPCIKPNYGFVKQLQDYEYQCRPPINRRQTTRT
jgi:protein-tyrosine phosphatase